MLIKMKWRTNITRFCTALTLPEMVIAMSMLGIIFASIVPQFSAIRNGWDSKQGAAESLQNGRILIDHFERNLSKAVKVTAVSESSDIDGYIQFEDNDGNNLRYEVANGYVQYGVVGDLSDLAGPVTQLQFTCYDACDLDTPITDVNSIRFVEVQTTLTNSAALGQDKTLAASAYLRTNGNNQVTWQNRDIGDVGAAGSAANADDTWTINASGADIWNTTDEFHYVYRSFSGDGQIIARVASVEYTDGWAKAGVMIRETMDADSRHAMVVVTPGNGVAFQRRTSTGDWSDHTAGDSSGAPYWVKLTRSGNTLTGYQSSNGATWTEIDSVSISMASDVYIGLAVTSHNDGTVCTSEIDSVSVSNTLSSGDAAIVLTTTPPIIDGAVDSIWSAVPAYSISNVVVGSIKSSSDLSGSWQALWDSSNIYYFIDITDDKLRNNSGTSWWDDDTIEIMIDADNNKGGAYDGVNDFQYGFRWDDSTIHTGAYSVDDTTGVDFDMVSKSGGYRLEVSIPWSTLGVTPSMGNLIGVEIYVDDDDNAHERDAQVSWHTTLSTAWEDTSVFGTAELSESDISGSGSNELRP
ncbi:MAG: DUF1349 domain-containing protein [Sedimentisphaerales bacterium]|nr:DUF1349 domain-containing protein [Sedimentisphaerales bacterium]